MTASNTTRPSQQEAEDALRLLLRWIGENPDRAGLKRTPARVVSAYEDWFGAMTSIHTHCSAVRFRRSAVTRRL